MSVMSRARERERDEALEFEFSALRRNGDERWNGRGNNGMGGARTGRRVLAATARVSLTVHKTKSILQRLYLFTLSHKYYHDIEKKREKNLILIIYFNFPHKHETHRSERWRCGLNTSAQRSA